MSNSNLNHKTVRLSLARENSYWHKANLVVVNARNNFWTWLQSQARGVSSIDLWDTLRRLTFLEQSQVFVIALHVLSAFYDLRTAGYLDREYRHPEHLLIVCSYFLFLFFLDWQMLVTLLTFPNQVPERLSLWLTVQWVSLGVSAFLTEALGAPFCCLPGVSRVAVDLLLRHATPSSLCRVARWVYVVAVLLAYTYVLGQNARLDFLMRVPDLNPVLFDDDDLD